MSLTWQSHEAPPDRPPTGAGGWLRAGLRGTALGLLMSLGFALLLLLRLVERPVFGTRRPLTPRVTQAVCRATLALLGIALKTHGRPMRFPGAMVANHSSWLDVIALNAVARIYFVSKSEIARWPGIGWLARATGTIFIERARTRARDQTALFARRLRAGHRLLFFPEGTSTDGAQVLPFKTSLFAAFLDPELDPAPAIQPITVVYTAPPGSDPRFYGWWGGMDLGPHLLTVLAARRQGAIEVTFHPPEAARDHPDRKALARACELKVRAAMPHTAA